MSVECQYANGLKLGVGVLPGRKRVALYRIRGGMLDVLAYFPSTHAAHDFCCLLWNCTYPDAEPWSEPIEEKR